MIGDPGALADAPRELSQSVSGMLDCATSRDAARAGVTRTLFRLYGFPPDLEMPAASVAREAWWGDGTERHWMRADPVYLEVGTRLVMRRHGDLAVTDGERDAFVRDLSECFDAHGFELSAPTPDAWYLAGDAPFDLATTPPDELAGRDAAECLPEGADPEFWQRMMSEVQILLNHHSANVERRRLGTVPVNSVWFWGSGRLPGRLSSPFESVDGDALADGLQQYAGPADGSGHRLFVLNRPGGIPWSELSGAMRETRRTRVLVPAQGRDYRFRAWHRLRFWRRRRGLGQWLAAWR